MLTNYINIIYLVFIRKKTPTKAMCAPRANHHILKKPLQGVIIFTFKNDWLFSSKPITDWYIPIPKSTLGYMFIYSQA